MANFPLLGPSRAEGTGAVSPGNSPGVLTVNGNLTLAGPYVVEVNGRTPGTQYDRLALNGLVALSGPLNVSMGYTPAAGDGYVILTNDGTDPVMGTFAGMPEGAMMTLGGLNFHITYHGGDGNDVALTSLIGSPPPAVVSTTINNGAAQRSRVTDLTIPFSQVVTFAGAPSAAFRLTRTGSAGEVTLAVDLSASTPTQTIAKLTFSGPL